MNIYKVKFTGCDYDEYDSLHTKEISYEDIREL